MSCIRPLLQYSDSVWDNCSSDSKKQLKSIHIEPAIIISGATKLCSIEKLFIDLGWETLRSCHSKRKLVLLYKILCVLAPNHLSELLPPLVQETTTYILRNFDNIQDYRAHSIL